MFLFKKSFFLTKKEKTSIIKRIYEERRHKIKMENDRFLESAADNDEKGEREDEFVALTPHRESFYHDITEPVKKEETDRYYEIFNSEKPKKRIWSVISFAFAIISVILCFFGWIGFAVGFLAVIFSLISRRSLKYFDMLSIIGLIVGIFGVVFGGVCLVWSLIFEEGIIESLISFKMK